MQQETDLVALIQGMQSALLEMQQRQTGVPVLEEDPPVGSPINVWWLYDGRLRGRKPNTQGVVEFTSTAAAGGTNTTTTPVPPQAPQPTRRVKTWASTWTRTFQELNVYDDLVKFGTHLETSTGMLAVMPRPRMWRVMIGFDAAAIRTELAGAAINSVEIGFERPENWPAVYLGATTATAPPASFENPRLSPRNAPFVWQRLGAQGDFRKVDVWLGEAFRDNLVQSLAIDQSLGNSRSSGALAATGPSRPRLRITYTK
jgi:hypothetical protein